MQKAKEQEKLSQFMAKCMYKPKTVQRNKTAQVKFHKGMAFERNALTILISQTSQKKPKGKVLLYHLLQKKNLMF